MKTTVAVVDDIDGEPGAKRVVFGLDGKSYFIDLAPHNEKELRTILSFYAEKGRPAKKGLRQVVAFAEHGSTPSPYRHSASSARRWLRDNGHEVPKRGRLGEYWMNIYIEGTSG